MISNGSPSGFSGPHIVYLGNKVVSSDRIHDWQDLQNMKYKLDGNYRLMNNITFPEPGMQGFPAEGFEPVGNNAYLDVGYDDFSGSLDGNNKTISGFYINRPTHDFVGLFGSVAKSNNSITAVKDLTISYRSVVGGEYVGVLAGWLLRGKTSRIKVMAASDDSVIRGEDYVGGLAGVVEATVESGSSVGGHISHHSHILGESYVGGLVGILTGNGKVTGYATSRVSGRSYVGGLVGKAIKSNPGETVSLKGYATGDVERYGRGPGSKRGFGGLVGIAFGVSVTGYATGNVDGKDASEVGGLIGEYEKDGTGSVVGYATGTVQGSRLLGGLVGQIGQFEAESVTGYWSTSESGISNSNATSVGVAISGIANSFYNPAGGIYYDLGADQNQLREIFNLSEFTNHFELPEASGKWPILKASVVGDLYEAQKELVGWNQPVTGDFRLEDSLTFSFPSGDEISIEELDRPRLITVTGRFAGYLDPTASKIVIDGREFSLTRTLHEGDTYLGLANPRAVERLVNSEQRTIQLKMKPSVRDADNRLVGPWLSDLGSKTLGYNLIRTWQELQNMKNKLDGDYRLMNKVTFPDPGTGGLPGNGFEPVGTYATPFTGTLDGQTHAIVKLYINLPNQTNVGLFGVISNANTHITAVKNLLIVAKKVVGYDGVGGLAGQLKAGSISHVRVKGYTQASKIQSDRRDYNSYMGTGGLVGYSLGSINDGVSEINVAGSDSTSYSVGGLVGSMQGGIVTGYATGTVSGTSSVGGLVGRMRGGTVTGYATGAVSGRHNSVGGLVGSMQGGIVTGYATGTVSGRYSVGGLVGSMQGGIVTGYATGTVSGHYYNIIGGLVGRMSGGTANGYWDIASSGRSDSVGSIIRENVTITVLEISSIYNVVYSPENNYLDGTTEVFNYTQFIQYFELPQRSGRWPILKESVISSDLYESQKQVMGWNHIHNR